MFIVLEISRPFQRRPSFFRVAKVTTFSITWLFFSVSLHPMRLDEMLDGYRSGLYDWKKS